MAFLALDDVELFYTDEGTGSTPVLLIHGWACDSHDWSWQLDSLIPRYRVIVPDLRGHGRSSVPADGYAPADYARDLAALIDAAGCGPCVAIGHSMGAIIASVLAVEWPGHVRALAVVDPPYGLGPIDEASGREFAHDLSVASDHTPALERLGLSLGDAPLGSSAHWRRRRMLGTPLHVLSRSAEAVHLGVTPIAGVRMTEALIMQRKVPVLACYANAGRADWERSLMRHPDSRAVSFDGCSHWLHQDAHDAFNATLTAWIDDVSEGVR
jgi:pimeloyl-ACP methyl ester carboxylesterase